MNSKPINLTSLPGLSASYCKQLAKLNITTTNELLQRARDPKECATLSRQLKLPQRHIQKWGVLCDLARVPSVGCQYNGLLLHSGIISVNQLAEASLEKLYSQVRRLHVSTLARSDLCPGPEQIALWIREARQLAYAS